MPLILVQCAIHGKTEFVVSEVNTRYGKNTLRCGWHPSENIWRMKANFAAAGAYDQMGRHNAMSLTITAVLMRFCLPAKPKY